jgi:uncharacterized protein YhhL (DUF1145 family)
MEGARQKSSIMAGEMMVFHGIEVLLLKQQQKKAQKMTFLKNYLPHRILDSSNGSARFILVG